MPSAATDANAALYERRNNIPEETKSMVSRASKATSRKVRGANDNRDNMSQISVLTPKSTIRTRTVDNAASNGSVTYVTATTHNTTLSTKQ